MNPITGLLAAPAAKAALQVANGAADLTSDSFAAVLDAAKKRHEKDKVQCGQSQPVADSAASEANGEGDKSTGIEELFSMLGFG